MKQVTLAAMMMTIAAASAGAAGFGKPCTSEPKEKWLSMEATEKVVTQHGYTIAKSKLKGTCVEIYARDAQGKRVELFIDPATGNAVGGNAN